MTTGNTIPEQIDQAMRYLERFGCLPDGTTRCILCSRSGRYVGIFAPYKHNQQRVGARPDQLRVFMYLLCNRCFKIPEIDRDPRVESIIFKNISVN